MMVTTPPHLPPAGPTRTFGPAFLRPRTLSQALEAKAEHPDAVPIAGGTELMVELNAGIRRPAILLDLSRVAELRDWSRDGRLIRLGAGVTHTRVVEELGSALPGLAIASRAVGSPQIRNRGTIGGNLVYAGDTSPPLLASNATVDLAGVRGTRQIPVADFFQGPRHSVLAPDELITAVRVEPARGPQQFAKVGTRNAMVTAVCSFAVALSPHRREVGTGIGAAGPAPLRAAYAEGFLRDALPWRSPAALPDSLLQRFGFMVAGAIQPDDVRGRARYRQHVLAVLARRCLGWAWEEYRCT